MQRREFITLISGAAAAWPLAARAQRAEKPVIGFLDGRLPDALANRLPGFHRGLREAGYVEGENVTVLYRYAENQIDRLPALADELTRRPVTVIVASGGPNVISAAKKATTTIPIVFLSGEDPARLGLVASLARPGGNLTGINFFNRELVGKQLGFLRELVPSANRIAVLVNPASTVVTETTLREAEFTARAKELKIQIVHAGTSREIDAAFAAFERDRPDALFVAAIPSTADVFNCRLPCASRYQRSTRAASMLEVGRLITYGSDITDTYRQAGIFVGRILKGAKPEDMPVVQADKLELIINAQSARALGLAVPQSLLVAADEVIE
jgi:putative ABC transport system substrate-binding protein